MMDIADRGTGRGLIRLTAVTLSQLAISGKRADFISDSATWTVCSPGRSPCLPRRTQKQLNSLKNGQTPFASLPSLDLAHRERLAKLRTAHESYVGKLLSIYAKLPNARWNQLQHIRMLGRSSAWATIIEEYLRLRRGLGFNQPRRCLCVSGPIQSAVSHSIRASSRSR